MADVVLKITSSPLRSVMDVCALEALWTKSPKLHLSVMVILKLKSRPVSQGENKPPTVVCALVIGMSLSVFALSSVVFSMACHRCGLFWKAFGIVCLIVVIWNAVRFAMWASKVGYLHNVDWRSADLVTARNHRSRAFAGIQHISGMC